MHSAAVQESVSDSTTGVVPKHWSATLLDVPRNNVPALVVLRSAAILLVVIGHFFGEFLFTKSRWFSTIVNFGCTGVDLLFVLSGLLIGKQLWNELQRTGNIRIGRFLVRRGLRIWPLYFCFVAGSAIVSRDIAALIGDALFVTDYTSHSGVGGSWSFSTEEQFYIAAPVLLIAMKTVSFARMWLVPVLGLLALSIGRFSTILIQGSAMTAAQIKQYMYFPIHTHADGLFIGLLIAWAEVSYPTALAGRRLRLAICSVAVGVAFLLHRADSIANSFLCLGLIYAAVTVVLKDEPMLNRMFAWRGFHVLSRLSFGLYLNHFGLLSLTAALALWIPVRYGDWATLPCFVRS